MIETLAATIVGTILIPLANEGGKALAEKLGDKAVSIARTIRRKVASVLDGVDAGDILEQVEDGAKSAEELIKVLQDALDGDEKAAKELDDLVAERKASIVQTDNSINQANVTNIGGGSHVGSVTNTQNIHTHRGDADAPD